MKNKTEKTQYNEVKKEVIRKISQLLSIKDIQITPFFFSFIDKDKIQLLAFIESCHDYEIVHEVLQYAKNKKLTKTEEFKELKNDKMLSGNLSVNILKQDYKYLQSTKREKVYIKTNFTYFFNCWYEANVSELNKQLIRNMLDSKYLHRNY
ncbi:MAG: hypothetical protein EKK61_04765 [Rickettsiales bacterium]|nr:MAG: hypothetical protein EKK61_04765 [Rickettsiales bacterium]